MATANVPYDLDRFLASVLQGLGLQPSEWRMNLMREWARGEGTGAGYNPLATTQQGLEDPEDPYWNSNGGNPVKNYRDFDSGVAQTVRTLKNGYYDKIIQSLQNEQIVPGSGDEARKWGTVGFANVLDSGQPPSGNGGAYTGDTTTSLPEDFQLPFTEEEYRQKYARQQTLLGEIWDPDYKTIRQDADPSKVAEYQSLTADLASYDNVIARGGHDYSDWLSWVNYQNQSKAIGAQNAANQAARQLQINSAAEDATMQELQEQRARADSAIQDQNVFRKSSHFDAPIGFRVGQENPMPEDQVFAKKVGEIADKVGPYVPIPDLMDIGPFSGSPKPKQTSPDMSLDTQSGPGDFYPGFETNGSMVTSPGVGHRVGDSSIPENTPATGSIGSSIGNMFGKAASRFGGQQTPASSLTFKAPPGYTPKPVVTPSTVQDQLSQFSPFARATGTSQFAEQARSTGRRTIGSLLFGGR